MLERAQLQASDISVTRMRSDRDDLPPGPPIPPQDAFSVIIQLRDFRAHTLWRGNRLFVDQIGIALQAHVMLAYGMWRR